MLTNAPEGTVTFELLQGSEDVSASRTSLNASTGKFEVQDVTAGAYLLRVTQAGKLRGETLVTVAEGDVTGVSMSLAPAVNVTGMTRMLGEPLKITQMPGFERARAAAGADVNVDDADLDRSMPATCNVSLRETGSAVHIANPTPVRRKQAAGDAQNGTFTIPDILPGSYRVIVQCYGGYAVSALSAGVDLLTNPTLVIQPGVEPAPIEIMVKPGGGTLNGELEVRPLPQNPGVLLIPASSNSTGPVMLPIGYVLQAQEKIEFMQAFLAPGDYTVYAFSDWQHVEFRNPAFLQTLTGGASLRIEDGKEQHISITQVIK